VSSAFAGRACPSNVCFIRVYPCPSVVKTGLENASDPTPAA
jgi:hypothetical protein